MSLAERFWAKVEKTEQCYIWNAAIGRDGYGRFQADGKTRKAHRAAWYLHTGEWPPDDMHVCHTCDVRVCVRFDHLFLGTAFDNMQDMASKGRGHVLVGSACHLSKLTEDTVLAIYEAAGPYRELAERYGTTKKNVANIKQGVSWAWLTRPGEAEKKVG